MARLEAVTMVPTLLSESAVQREWGRIGQGKASRRQAHGDEVAACRAAEVIIGERGRSGRQAPHRMRSSQ